jgi:hypothetical protein
VINAFGFLDAAGLFRSSIPIMSATVLRSGLATAVGKSIKQPTPLSRLASTAVRPVLLSFRNPLVC